MSRGALIQITLLFGVCLVRVLIWMKKQFHGLLPQGVDVSLAWIMSQAMSKTEQKAHNK